MASFNLTAELNLRGPSNLNQVVSNIRRQLSTISLDLNINPATSRGIQAVTSDVRNLGAALRDAQANAVALSTTLRGLGASASNVARATSNLGSNLGTISGSANNTATAIKAASSEMSEFGRQSALAIRRFAAFSVATGAVYALSRAVSSAYGEFVNFNKEFVRLQQVTDSTASGLTSLSNEITRLSSSLGVSSQELLQVSVTLAQAGLSAGETKTALEALAKSALAPSFDSLNDTVEGSIALMRQFGISAADLESSLGSVNAVAAKFAVEASDIIAAIQRTGGVFANASKGVSEGKDALNEFLAVFTSVRATTRESAETIATGLRTIFTRIQRTDTIDALKQYGISLTDLEGKFVGPFEAVRRLSEGLKALDPRDLRFSSIVEELGGFRQIGKVIPLIQQFESAQKALGVAQRGTGSLAADAATAQEALSVRINKVREQFVALIRDIGQSQGFQTFVDISLKLASALISVADAAKDVLPAIAAIGAIRGFGALGQFFGGFSGGLSRNRPRGFAKGGYVPGSGNRDTVSAMLTPGEFVIRKKAVEKIGVGNLARLNRNNGGPIPTQQFNDGGEVQRFMAGKFVMPKARGKKGAKGYRGPSGFKPLSAEEYKRWAEPIYDQYDRDPSLPWGSYMGIPMPPPIVDYSKRVRDYSLVSGAGLALGKDAKGFEVIAKFGKAKAKKAMSEGKLKKTQGALTFSAAGLKRGPKAPPGQMEKALAAYEKNPEYRKIMGLDSGVKGGLLKQFEAQAKQKIFISPKPILDNIPDAKSRLQNFRTSLQETLRETTDPKDIKSLNDQIRKASTAIDDIDEYMKGSVPANAGRASHFAWAMRQGIPESSMFAKGGAVRKYMAGSPGGVQSLTDEELLKLLKGSGVARTIAGISRPVTADELYGVDPNKRGTKLKNLSRAIGIPIDQLQRAAKVINREKFENKKLTTQEKSKKSLEKNLKLQQADLNNQILDFGLVGLRYGSSSKSKDYKSVSTFNVKKPKGFKSEKFANVRETGSGQLIRVNSATVGEKLGASQAKNLQNILLKSFEKSVEEVAKKMAAKTQTGIDKASSVTKAVENSDFYNIVGTGLESALGLLGAPLFPKTEKTKSIDFPKGLGNAAGIFGAEFANMPTDVTRTIGGEGKGIASYKQQIERWLQTPEGQKRLTKFQASRAYATGGSVQDTVPALLTPGEFVINKKAAKSIGSARLNRLNKADKIQGFNKGGPVGSVQSFATGGSALPARPTNATPFNMVIPPNTAQALQEIARALENMGVSASEAAMLLERGGAISVEASERAFQADVNRLRIAGASAGDIYNAEQRLAQVREENARQINTSRQLTGLTGGQLQDIQTGAELGQRRIIENRRAVMQSRGRSADEIAAAIADPEFQDYARRTAFERSTAAVTGRSTRDLQSAGIGGQDIEAYVNRSSMDFSTLKQMDQQLLETRRQQLRNDASYTSASAAQQRRMMRELKARTNEEIAERRNIINQLRKDRGLSAGFLGRQGQGISRILGTAQTGMALLGMGELRDDAFGQSSRARRFTGGFKRFSAGMQGAGMGLTFAGGMIGDTVGKAVGGKEGQAISSAVSAFVGSAGIGMMFGPIGALTGVVVGATTAIQAWKDSIIEATLQEEAEKIERAQQQVNKSFEKISKAKDPQEAQAALRSAAAEFQKISTSESKRQSAMAQKTLQEPGFFGSIYEYFAGDGSGARMAQAEKEITSSAKSTSVGDMLPQAFRASIEQGMTFEQVEATFAPGELDRLKELYALSAGDEGNVVRGLVTKREDMERRGIDTTSISAAIRDFSDRIFREEVGQQIKDQAEAEQKMAIAAAAAKIEIDLLNQSLAKIASAADKAATQFEETQRQMAMERSIMFGGGQIQGPDRSQENVLENIMSYSIDEIRNVIGKIGSDLQFNPELTKEAQNAAVAQKILQQELPQILAEIGAREGKDFDAESTSSQIIQKKLSEALDGFLPPDRLKEVVENFVKNFESRLKKRKGTTVSEIAGDEGAIKSLLEYFPGVLETFGGSLKQVNDTVEVLRKNMDLWAQDLSNATELKIGAQNISIEAGNQLSKALGKELSLGDMNQAFDNTISTLTQRIGAGGAGIPGTGTLDPGTIMQRMLEREQDARDIQKQLDTEKPPVGSDRFVELSESLKRAKLEAVNLSKAHTKLQNDSTRAANALTKIGELRQLQETRQSSFLDLLKDINNPEAMTQFATEVESFFAQMAGQGNMQNLPQAIAGLERQMAVLPQEQAAAIREDFIRSVRDTLVAQRDASGAPRFSKEVIDTIIKNIGADGNISPEMKGLINEFYKYTEVQKNAANQAAEALITGANNAAASLETGATNAMRTMSAAGQDNPRQTVPLNPVEKKRGGLIYASKGQYVNFQPKGSDTVPAMLTPGEFVVNAKATKKNIGLLKAINNGSKHKGSTNNLNYFNEGGLVDPELKSLIEILYDTPDSENMSEDDLYNRLKTGGIPLIANSNDTEMLYNFKDAYEKRKREQEESVFQQQRANEDQQRQSEINTRKQRDAATIAATEAAFQESRIKAAEAKKLAEESRARLEEIRKQEKERKQKAYDSILSSANKTEEQKLEDRRRRFPEIAWSKPKTEADLASIAAGTNPGVNKAQKINDIFDTDPLFKDYRYNENLASAIKNKITEIYSDDLDDHMPTMSSLESLARTTSLDFAKQTRESAERKQLARQEQNRAMIAAATANFVNTLPFVGDGERYESAFRATYLGDKSAQLHIKDAEKEGAELQKSVGEMVERAKNYEGPLGMLAYTSDNIVSGITGTIGAPGGDERTVADIKDRMDKYKQKQIEAGNTDFSWENHTNPIISALGTTGRYTGELFGGTVGSALNTIGGAAMLSGAGFSAMASDLGFDTEDYTKALGKKGFEALGAAGSDFIRAMEQTGRGVAGLGEWAMGYDDPTQLLKGKTQGQLLDERNVQEAGDLGAVVRGAQMTRDIAGESLLPFPGLGKGGAPRSIAGRMDDLDPLFTRQRGIPREGIDANLFDNRNVKFPTGSGSNIQSRLTFGNAGDLLDQERINATLGHLTSFRTGLTKGADLAERGLAGARDLTTKAIIDAGLMAGRGAMTGISKGADFAQNIMGYLRGPTGPFMAGKKTKKYPFYDPRRWLGFKKYDTMTKKAMQTARKQKRAGKKTTPIQQQPTTQQITQPQQPPPTFNDINPTPTNLGDDIGPGFDLGDLGDDVLEQNAFWMNGRFVPEDEYIQLMRAQELQEQTKNMVVKGTAAPEIIAKTRELVTKAQEQVRDIMVRYASSPEKAKQIIDNQKKIFDIKALDIDPNLKSKVNAVTGKESGVAGEYRRGSGTIGIPSADDIVKSGVIRHEVAHGVQANLGMMQSRNTGKYFGADSLKTLQPQIDEFTKPGGAYEKLIKDLKGGVEGVGFYDPREVSKNHFELFTSLVQGADTEAFQNNAQAQDMLRAVIKAMGYKKGGPVYASSGALIPYQPKGTDTVPAMLTPGEFVVNAKATRKNLGLLKAINGGAKGYSKGGVAYLAEGGEVSQSQNNEIDLEELSGLNGMLYIGEGFSRLWALDYGGELDKNGEEGKKYAMEQFDVAAADIQNGIRLIKEQSIKSKNKEDDTLVENFANSMEALVSMSSSTIGGMTDAQFSEWRNPFNDQWNEFKRSVTVRDLEKVGDGNQTARSYLMDSDAISQQAALEEQLKIELNKLEQVKPKLKFNDAGFVQEGDPADVETYHEASRQAEFIQDQLNKLIKENSTTSNQNPQQNTEQKKTFGSNLLDSIGSIASNVIKFVGGLPQINIPMLEDKEDPYAGMSAYEKEMTIRRQNYQDQQAKKRENFRLQTGRDPITGRIGGPKTKLTDEQKALNRKRAELRAKRSALDTSDFSTIMDEIKLEEEFEKTLSPEQMANRKRAERLALGAIDPDKRREGLGSQQERYEESRQEWLASLSPEQKNNRERTERLSLVSIDPKNRTEEQQARLDILKIPEDERTPEQIAELEELRKEKEKALYASRGTLVPYQPRGTDTVPAMLTPGEFVVNRKAAKQNMGLLKAINKGQNVQPQLFNKGGIVPTQYYQAGSNGPVSGGSSSGGGVSNISVDASALDAAFSNFNSYVSSLSSVIDGFTQGTTELAGLSQAIGALGNLGLREGASLMANAGISVKEATTAFSSAMTQFNTAATSLATAISSIPQSISLTVSGSIPVTVSVQIEGGTGTGTDTAAIEQSIMDKVALAINSATQGGITIDTAIA